MDFRRLWGILSLLCLFGMAAKAQQKVHKGTSAIVLEVEFDKGFNNSGMHLKFSAYDEVVQRAWKPLVPKIETSKAKWLINSKTPVWIDLNSILGPENKLNLFEPGDSIHVDLRGGKPVYSGTNSAKFQMLQELKESRILLKDTYISAFNSGKTQAVSVEEYLKWSSFFDKDLELIEQTFQYYHNKLSPFAFGYLKADLISDVEYERLRKFSKLRNQASNLNISPERLGQLFDSTVYHKSVKWLHSYTGKIRSYYYYYDFIRKSVERNYHFNTDHELFKTAARKLAYADLAKKTYSGDMLQGFFVYLLTERGLKEHTYGEDKQSPEIEHLLKEFYEMPGYKDYKTYVKGYEQMIREWVISVGHTAPDFSLTDVNGKLVSKKALQGKLVVLSFLDNSSASLKMAAALQKVNQTFKGNTDVVFVSCKQFANGLDKAHPVLKYYNVRAYPEFGVEAFPKVFLLDAEGKFVFNGEFMRDNGGPLKRVTYRVLPDPTKDNGSGLSKEIYKQLALINDGPYVFHEKGGITAYTIHALKATKQTYPAQKDVLLTAHTDDLRKTFSVQLKANLVQEPSVTANRPIKLFVLSDIEGNFEAFRKLLQANNIIDATFNWTFGKGHLVFAGDMFDRGLQVTECLWLVYTLEEKARKAGGNVHFVLGNHEIMNLQGDHRYAVDKYKASAAAMGKTLVQVYNEDSELGRWLRTKNIVEQIGDLLFTHGGISAEMIRLKLPATEINALARPNYANKQEDYKDVRINTIMSSKIGPFWYRGYYAPKFRATERAVDSVLTAFNVKHIVTGHTIVADTISIHYGGKVINTDTKHKAGRSEGLLVEGANFYRVNAGGKRVLLFREEENN